MMEIEIWHTMPEPARQRLCAWVEANGLDPNRIPADSTIRINGDSVTVEEYVTDDDGKTVLDPHEEYRALRTTRTVPLLKPWPGVSA